MANKRQGGEGMNIDKTSGSSFIQSYQKQVQVSPAAKNKPVQKEDQVQISSQAKEMFEKTSEVDAARQEKINLLKAQIESGEYVNNSEKVADKVFQFWFGK
jgi:negative regulator of flagellin synthesis FlgM